MPVDFSAVVYAIQPRYQLLVLLATFVQLRFGELIALRRSVVDVVAAFHVAGTSTGSGSAHLRMPVSRPNSGFTSMTSAIREAHGQHRQARRSKRSWLASDIRAPVPR